MSTQDYLLQSIRPLFIPLGVLLIAGLVRLRAHATLMGQVDRHPGRRVWKRGAALLA